MFLHTCSGIFIAEVKSPFGELKEVIEGTWGKISIKVNMYCHL